MEKEAGVVTIDHDEIRDWLEDRDGHPALAAQETEGAITQLRIDFGHSRERLERISWDEFFKRFESESLAFLYDKDAMDGAQDAICEFVSRSEHMDRIENGGVEEAEEEDEFEEEREDADEEEGS